MTDTPASPTQDAIDAFNAFVQSHIDAQAKLGIELTWTAAKKQAENFFKNQAEDPEGFERYFAGLAIDPVDLEARVTGLEGTSVDHEGRLRSLEGIIGGSVVGPDS